MSPVVNKYIPFCAPGLLKDLSIFRCLEQYMWMIVIAEIAKLMYRKLLKIFFILSYLKRASE